MAAQRVGMVIHEGVQALDVAGPIDAFHEANSFLDEDRRYETILVACTRDPVRASNQMRLIPDLSFAEATRSFDILLVAGSPTLPDAPPGHGLTEWLAAAAMNAGLYGSICTGAFALGHAGLLKQCRVTTHWQCSEKLAAQFPDARVDRKAVYVRDGSVVTSAGVTAGIDLALALIEEYHGARVALAVATRLLVVAQRHDRIQVPRAAGPGTADVASPVERVKTFVRAHIANRHSLDSLAGKAGMSSRNLTRHFVQETGLTPYEFVQQARTDAARTLLETTDRPLKWVAHCCGFGSADRMRIVFSERLGVTPAQYRINIRPGAAP